MVALMLFLGYDPGGKGKHGVAAIQVSTAGELLASPTCAVASDAEAAWRWLSTHEGAVALGIDTLLAWSPSGGRACDDALRRTYRDYAATVIPQNSLYSSMTINGAIVARWAGSAGLALFESHPKLLVRTEAASIAPILPVYRKIIDEGSGKSVGTRQADDMADAVVAAWCAAQGYLGHWSTDLFKARNASLVYVVEGARYPWPETVK